jgi:hypothetical protein
MNERGVVPGSMWRYPETLPGALAAVGRQRGEVAEERFRHPRDPAAPPAAAYT